MEDSKEKNPENGLPVVTTVVDHNDDSSQDDRRTAIPLNMKILSVVVVSMIGFGGHWSSGVTGALKSTLKKASRPNHLKTRPLSNTSHSRNSTSPTRNTLCLNQAKTSSR
ncbi:MFS transporter [Ilyonectria robusta]